MTVSLYTCGHCKLPQLVGQPCHCRTPEDEAFDELAKRQGAWGGGFTAKRKMAADKFCDANCVWTDHHPDCNMAADKLQEPVREALKLALDDIAKIPTLTHGLLVKLADVEAVINAALAQPAQEPVAYVTGVYNGRFVIAPLNPAMLLPVGMAFYSTPQHTATWVGLTDEEIKEIIGSWGDTPVKGYTRKLFDQIEAKLRSKNNG
ncbi:hypothetical protein UFOVP1276_28 [uncultured Caudovirales phage]|uniref:Uncharacterized protein n=1 Tax=uncultured Caudovirales phage TaxID=2100421 RepID=A0A6J5P8P6_9CAUD|nr:hypothetical protein UFOVP875_59 [uncultured Caudovirales phage]CAB4195069.1 hypothetical protein UFOVP1276_28 [uncultured Caudovirales phage]CAB4205178.1 hypothetical protein UFOVP1403_38 [uncultured Caudovirales phage]CAB5238082.1 hypothetical protein UFOVP1507_22 [uncultured Caudovirales phage]